ncbi:MAG TPA: hypothetical protein VLE53_13200 [Gemmatimonadaceae bacterium]|nr:hypothetical protein [Gemmatimonadaceae bacterium]
MRTAALLLLIAMASACASGGGVSTSATAPQPARGSANLITEEEIAQGTYQTALEIVQGLRPSMTRYRATTTSATGNPSGYTDAAAATGGVVVYMDESRLGEVSTLSSIPAQRVREIRYISARDATTRWGTGHTSGVIQVITKK